ncbi:heavy metal translocating P-type ATPase [Chthonobacter rhizosphaerae]|uniref:heavy metal translocating P-type ATPase n=1 Tax=Chthonobacter rhizosphaerae TaxID=2735553 RepID=UPI001FE88AF3|nr:heavy metal translocating P-type ATPase [Chthonobacter rhizosphaerae]
MSTLASEPGMVAAVAATPPRRDWDAFTTADADGRRRLMLAVEGITCAACMGDIERGLGRLDGVASARVNLANRRVAVVYDPATVDPDAILARMEALHYPARPFDPTGIARPSETSRRLLRCLGVSGFGAMNVMLLSVSVWSGNVTDITPETRDFFHWMSALVAIPCVAYAAAPFYESAIAAIRRRAVNMDVPITIGVTLAMGLSLVNTLTHAHEAFFDSALMLLFFLLLGRFLDENMRRRTAVEAETLAVLRADSAVRVEPDGGLVEVPVSRVRPGDRVLVRPGEKVPVDGRVETGASELDTSLVTGETVPARVGAGDMVHAGTVNGFGSLTVTVTAAADGTLVAEIERLIGEAESAKSAHLRLADKAARLYAPVVHSAAALTFVGWMIAGLPWNDSLVIAIAVLIITCPCALALAIPAVQVVAAGRLFRNGVLLNAGDAIERLAAVDTIVFDKTGTLTTPEPTLVGPDAVDADVLRRAAAVALASRHPLARALAKAGGAVKPAEQVTEHPGEGVEAMVEGRTARLGSLDFCAVSQVRRLMEQSLNPTASFIAYREGAAEPVVFALAQTLKADAKATVAALRKLGCAIEILSGDRAEAVAEVARVLHVDEWIAEATPASKIARLNALKAAGRTVLMVGDGLNDAPSLAAAPVSLSPVSGAHLAQSAADAVFLGERLAPVRVALEVARAARRLMTENLWIAVVYNAIAVPVAVAGHVTPLVAALAMSGSSLIVTVNALRLRRVARPAAPARPAPAAEACPVPATIRETAR